MSRLGGRIWPGVGDRIMVEIMLLKDGRSPITVSLHVRVSKRLSMAAKPELGLMAWLTYPVARPGFVLLSIG
jgi:hypothetical protein